MEVHGTTPATILAAFLHLKPRCNVAITVYYKLSLNNRQKYLFVYVQHPKNILTSEKHTNK